MSTTEGRSSRRLENRLPGQSVTVECARAGEQPPFLDEPPGV